MCSLQDVHKPILVMRGNSSKARRHANLSINLIVGAGYGSDHAKSLQIRQFFSAGSVFSGLRASLEHHFQRQIRTAKIRSALLRDIGLPLRGSFLERKKEC